MMTTKPQLRALSQLRANPLLHTMDSRHLKKLAAVAVEAEFGKNEIIYQRGQSGQALYLIEEGEVTIATDTPDQESVVLHTLGPGQLFGWSALFPQERKMFITRATRPTRVLLMPAEQIRAAWQADTSLEYALVRRGGEAMANRLMMIRQQLAAMMPLPQF
jgi:SulP family sulfate permease